MSVKSTSVPGDMAVSKDVTVGGQLSVRGSTTIDRNIKIKGWLDAPNIKAPLKGLYKDYDALEAEYPRPRPGWFALTKSTSREDDGENIYVDLYRVEDGSWEKVATEALAFKLFLDEIEDTIDSALEDIRDLETLLLGGVIVPSSIAFNATEDSVTLNFTATSLEEGDKTYPISLPMLSEENAGIIQSSWYQSLKCLYTLYKAAEEKSLYLKTTKKIISKKSCVIMNFLDSDGEVLSPKFFMSIVTAEKAGLMTPTDKVILDNIYSAWKDAMAKATGFNFTHTKETVTMSVVGVNVDGTKVKVSVPYPMVSKYKAGALPATYFGSLDFLKTIYDALTSDNLRLVTTTTIIDGMVKVHFACLDEEGNELAIGADFLMSLATAEKAGLMSAVDKEHLDKLYTLWQNNELGTPKAITEDEIDEMLSKFTFAECKGCTVEAITQAEADEMLSKFTFAECKGSSVAAITQAEIDEMLENFTFAEGGGGSGSVNITAISQEEIDEMLENFTFAEGTDLEEASEEEVEALFCDW